MNQKKIERLLDILHVLVEGDELCSFDHHGYCQGHGWFGEPGECGYREARELLAEIEVEVPDREAQVEIDMLAVLMILCEDDCLNDRGTIAFLQCTERYLERRKSQLAPQSVN